MKLTLKQHGSKTIKSPPAWGRGLKCFGISHGIDPHTVAPCVGAWVEIFLPMLAARN